MTTKNSTPIQSRAAILAAVATAIQASGPNDNWTDAVDDALAAIGVKTETPDRDDDPWVIAQLVAPIEGFGRVVVYREGRGEGPDAYEIV